MRFSFRSWTNLGFSTRRSLPLLFDVRGSEKGDEGRSDGIILIDGYGLCTPDVISRNTKSVLPSQLIPNSTHLSLYGTPGLLHRSDEARLACR